MAEKPHSLEGGSGLGRSCPWSQSFNLCLTETPTSAEPPTPESPPGLISCSLDDERKKLFFIPLHAYKILICKNESLPDPIENVVFQ